MHLQLCVSVDTCICVSKAALHVGLAPAAFTICFKYLLRARQPQHGSDHLFSSKVRYILFSWPAFRVSPICSMHFIYRLMCTSVHLHIYKYASNAHNCILAQRFLASCSVQLDMCVGHLSYKLP